MKIHEEVFVYRGSTCTVSSFDSSAQHRENVRTMYVQKQSRKLGRDSEFHVLLRVATQLPISLVYKALPYMGIEHSSDSEAHHLITMYVCMYVTKQFCPQIEYVCMYVRTYVSMYVFFSRLHDFILPVKEAVTPQKMYVCMYVLCWQLKSDPLGDAPSRKGGRISVASTVCMCEFQGRKHFSELPS